MHSEELKGSQERESLKQMFAMSRLVSTQRKQMLSKIKEMPNNVKNVKTVRMCSLAPYACVWTDPEIRKPADLQIHP